MEHPRAFTCATARSADGQPVRTESPLLWSAMRASGGSKAKRTSSSGRNRIRSGKLGSARSVAPDSQGKMTRSACLFRRGSCQVKVWGSRCKPTSGFILGQSGTRLATTEPSSQSVSVAVLPNLEALPRGPSVAPPAPPAHPAPLGRLGAPARPGAFCRFAGLVLWTGRRLLTSKQTKPQEAAGIAWPDAEAVGCPQVTRVEAPRTAPHHPSTP